MGMDAVTELPPAATFPQVLAFASRLAHGKALDATVPVGQVVVPPALAAGELALDIIRTKAIEKNYAIFCDTELSSIVRRQMFYFRAKPVSEPMRHYS